MPKGIGIGFLLLLMTIVLLVTNCEPADLSSSPASSSRRELDELLERIARNSFELRQQSAVFDARFREYDAGFINVGSKNFSVGAPSRAFAEAVLAAAESMRRELALEWLGKELPEGKQFTRIHVELSTEIDEGLCDLDPAGSLSCGHNRIWLTTTPELALGSTLRHELTHLVLHHQFPAGGGIPAFANEGICSRMDDANRHARRSNLLGKIVQTEKWPSLVEVMTQRTIAPTDELAYTVSASLTEFFLSRGDRKKYLDFVSAGSRIGWPAATQQFYGIATTRDLQREWQTFVTQTVRKAQAN
jgi:hypothetical protein